MAFAPNKTLISAAALLAVGVTGYYLYSAFAVQGQGNLAQAPLNIQSSVPPSFIMGVDDSGSMTFETLFSADEQAYWNDSSGTTRNGFFVNANAPDTSDVLRTSGRGLYYHVIQNGIRLDQSGNNLDTNTNGVRLGIPPLDLFGFARSPDYNKQYFNPAVTYLPWQNADNTPWADSVRTAAKSDPRAAGSSGTRGPNPIVTYNFEADETRTTNYFAFRVQPGMKLPKDTVYYMRSDRHPNGCGGLGTTNGTRNTWVTLGATVTVSTTNNLNYNPGNGNHRGGGCEVHIRYFPAVVYLLPSTPPPPGFDTSKAKLVANAGGPGIDMYKYELRAGNFLSNYDNVIKNFANWYTYYGNRNRALVASMSHSLSDIKNMRVGYFSINKRSGNQPGMVGGNVVMRNLALTDEKASLYSNIYTLPADGGTPTRSATVYMGDQFKRTGNGAPVELICQKNAGMLFTDGYTNESPDNGYGNEYRNIGDTDGALKKPLGKSTNGNTIADIAYSFYANNIRPDMTPVGKVPIPDECTLENGSPNPDADLRLDCQANLHMNFYGITLGATGEYYGRNAAATANPYTTFPNWSATGTMNLQPANVDDIWHATLNTRGEFINAKTPADVADAMRRILASVGGGKTPSGSIALTGSRVGTGSLTVVPFYESKNNGTDWYSKLTGTEVKNDAATGALVFDDIWEASEKLPATRNIWFGTTTAAVKPAVAAFTAANLGASPFQTLCSDALLARCTEAKVNSALGISVNDAVAYLRGLTTGEKKNGGKLRDRTTVLGDIVNSSPVISSPNIDDYGYAALRGTSPTDFDPFNYADFLENKKTRKSNVYVGANDGMLHGFDGETGVERFAYIPASAVGHMGNLLFPYKAEDKNDQVFSHTYFVDGPITVSDARYNSTWQTVLVGTAGAGGRSVFALNVSDPSNFAAGNVLWELNDKVSNADVKNNIGYVLGTPVIVPVKIGNTVKWKAVFGNGYGSVNGKATLFVVDIGDGSVEYVQAEESSPPATSNGLGNIIAIDRWLGSTADAGRDGYADTVYGGDQNGAVWKFDLRTAKPTVSVDGEPVFVAKDAGGARQPIMGGFEAAVGPSGGVMLYFGTGSFSFENDPSDKTMQSIYGILDTFQDVPVAGRSELLQQKIVLGGENVRTTTNEIGLGKLGWYMDLGVSGMSGDPFATGERFVGNPVIASGIVFFPTYNPNSTADCGTNGNNWLYGLNALNGGSALNGVHVGSPDGTGYGSSTGAVQLNTSGTAPVKDVAVLTTPKQGMLPLNPDPDDLKKALDSRCSMVVQVAGAEPLYLPRPCGRQSWRQIQ